MKFFIAIFLLAFSLGSSIAQDSSSTKKLTWGAQVDWIATYPLTGFTEGITLHKDRHKFQLSLIFLKQPNEASFKIWGPYFNYKYFAFKPKKYFNAYFFGSLQGGKSETQISLSRLSPVAPFEIEYGSRFNLTKALMVAIGPGFELNLHRRFYLDLALGAGMVSRNIQQFDHYLNLNTNHSETVNQMTIQEAVFYTEWRGGFGFRF